MRAKEFAVEQVVTEKNVPTNPSKWNYYKNQAKKKFDVYPSAYANGWAAKKYKAAGGKWKTKESFDITPDELMQKIADEPNVDIKAKMMSKLKVLQKPFFIINKNKPASAQNIQRFKTELEAAEWIKKNGPMFSHGGKAFEIYKGDPDQLGESVITELNVAGEKTDQLLYYYSRFKNALTPSETNIKNAIEKELARRGVDYKQPLAADKFTEDKLPCPQATQDLAINTENRDRALKQFNYGPLNVDVPGDYWEKIADYWKTTVEAAKASNCSNCIAFDISPNMKDCMPGDTFDDDGELGYCWMHHFKCHSARSCHTWAKGGPIKDNDESAEWQGKAFGVNEASQSPYAIGMAKAMKMYNDKPPLSKKTIRKAHEIAKAVMKDDINEEDLSNCKYGKYYCTTDKKYKCRQGPKQKRS